MFYIEWQDYGEGLPERSRERNTRTGFEMEVKCTSFTFCPPLFWNSKRRLKKGLFISILLPPTLKTTACCKTGSNCQKLFTSNPLSLKKALHPWSHWQLQFGTSYLSAVINNKIRRLPFWIPAERFCQVIKLVWTSEQQLWSNKKEIENLQPRATHTSLGPSHAGRLSSSRGPAYPLERGCRKGR